MEVTTIPDIRERNDRPKDKQPKHQAVSIVQRQMVQKFVKELNDSAKQPDSSDSAERTATEQVEMTAREIVYETVQLTVTMTGLMSGRMIFQYICIGVQPSSSADSSSSSGMLRK